MRRHDRQQALRILGVGSAALLSATAVLLVARFIRGGTAEAVKTFAQKAFAGGLFEIESSQLALDRSGNGDVCQFAHAMIDDHTRINRGLNTVLSKSDTGADIKKNLDSVHQKMLDELAAAPDEKFDRAYIEAQKKVHIEAVKLFGTYARKFEKDSALKDFAERILPTLKNHQKMAQNFDLNQSQT